MTTMQKTHKDILRYNIDRVKHLPDPQTEFRQSDLHPRLDCLVDKLTTAKIIEQEGEVRLPESTSETVNVWSVRPKAHAYIQDLLDQRDDYSAPALPCGDHGFLNEGDQIACKFEDCGGAWSKHELRHFWEHGELPSTDATASEVIAGD